MWELTEIVGRYFRQDGTLVNYPTMAGLKKFEETSFKDYGPR